MEFWETARIGAPTTGKQSRLVLFCFLFPYDRCHFSETYSPLGAGTSTYTGPVSPVGPGILTRFVLHTLWLESSFTAAAEGDGEKRLQWPLLVEVTKV